MLVNLNPLHQTTELGCGKKQSMAQKSKIKQISLSVVAMKTMRLPSCIHLFHKLDPAEGRS